MRKTNLKRIVAIFISTLLILGITSGTVFSAQSSAVINIDFNKKFQTMDGFGFFGAQDVWWGSGGSYSDAWLEKIISDLGITIWRNEIAPYNPVESNTVSNPQSANWAKQKPVIMALKKKADDRGVPLKIILSVWSPPGEFKLNSSELGAYPFNAATRAGIHYSTLNGGTMDPMKYKDYSKWIVDALKMYKDIGVDVYAVSLQNEPLFVETYNSCVYTSQWYVDLINNVVPGIKASFPNVKIFGSENMLEGEASNPFSFYTGTIASDKYALKNVDFFAFHGYSNGVQATAIAQHKALWESVYDNFYVNAKKNSWMTETSGFAENWTAVAQTPGALDLGLAIASSLKYGKAAGWVYWQGSEARSNAQSVYSLMDGTTVKKRYYVSKHFYKFIRPGAVMIDASTSDPDILSTAFYEPTTQSFSSVIINSSTVEKTMTFAGSGVPQTYTEYLTTGTSGQDCKDMGSVSNGSIILPANSIMTLVSQKSIPFVTPKPTPTLVPTLAPGATPYPLSVLPVPNIILLNNSSDMIIGDAINGGTVKVTYGSKTANIEVSQGSWDVTLQKPLPAGTKVTAKLTLYNGRQSFTRSIYVIPTTPYVTKLKNNATLVSGIATKSSIVYVKIGSKTYSTKASKTKGIFSVKVIKLKKGVIVSVKAKAGGRYSFDRKIKVV